MSSEEPITTRAPHRVGMPMSTQSWRDVVFLHWPCAPETVHPLLPPRTMPDLLDGMAWVGLVALRIPRMHTAGIPASPWLGRVNEINLRTYCVDEQERRSLVFVTMEASHPLFVLAARITGRLPYCLSTVHTNTGASIDYRSRRHFPAPRGVGVALRVRVGTAITPTAGDHFRTARWRMHTRWYGTTWYLQVDHQPWPLHQADLVDFRDFGLLQTLGLPPPTEIPSVRYSPGVDARLALPAPLTRSPQLTRAWTRGRVGTP